MKLDYSLLRKLLVVKSPSGEEAEMKKTIKELIGSDLLNTWEIIEGSEIQDCLILRKGEPKVAFIAHMDTIGFTARYENQLVPIGSPEVGNSPVITGSDSLGHIQCKVTQQYDGRLYHNFGRPIDRGTSLVFKPEITETAQTIQAPYLDDRVGIFLLLKLAQEINDGFLVFSCWEESGGGSVSYLARIMYEIHHINQVVVADVTWVTDGIFPGKGAVISLRDRNLPRKSFVDRIRLLIDSKGIEHQLEVEGEGSSDGGELQRSPYPINWVFIGPPVENTHSSHEKVHKKDIISSFNIYRTLAESIRF